MSVEGEITLRLRLPGPNILKANLGEIVVTPSECSLELITMINNNQISIKLDQYEFLVVEKTRKHRAPNRIKTENVNLTLIYI